MVTTRDNYEHFIHEVESCSIAEYAGLQIGDHIETINGIRIVVLHCNCGFKWLTPYFVVKLGPKIPFNDESVTGRTHSSVVKILSKYKTTVQMEIIRSHSSHSKRVFYC